MLTEQRRDRLEAPMRWNECPACGDMAEPDDARPAVPARTFGPGELAVFDCAACGERFRSVMPEPPDLAY